MTAGLTTSRTTVERLALALALVVAGASGVRSIQGVLDGPRPTGPLVVPVSAVVVLLAATVLLRRGAVPARHLDVAFCVVVAVPVSVTCVQVVLTGPSASSAVAGLTLVVTGAVGARRRLVVGLVAAANLGWVLALASTTAGVAAVPDDGLRLALSSLLAVGVHEVRQRSESRLRGAMVDLERHVADLAAARDVVAESERRFHGVFTHSPVGVSLSDERGLFVEVNQAVCDLVDRPSAHLIGRSASEITHPDDLVLNASAGRLIAEAEDGVARLDIRYVRPDGSVRHALLYLNSVPGPRGEDWTLAHVVDVTENRRTEQALRRSEENLHAVSAITRCVQEGTDPRPVVLDALGDLVRCSHVALVEAMDADTLVVSRQAGAPELDGVLIPMASTSATAHTWTTRESLYLADVPSHPLVNPALLELHSSQSLLLEPVLERGEVVAVLVLGWDQAQLELPVEVRRSARMLADELGPALSAQRLRTELESMATTDPLTRVANRRRWDERVALLVADARRTGRPLTLALVDLDHFKSYNDTHGHGAGDDLLRAFAAAASGTLREVDVFARWGGEEFVVALPDCSATVAAAALERVRGCVPEAQTCSVGYATWDGAETAQQCLSRADVALYRAKLAGRDQLAAA